tara:strand:+ start:146 stop:1063 length:918 start_codon:yes stop_codon:yes gene_type:complete
MIELEESFNSTEFYNNILKYPESFYLLSNIKKLKEISQYFNISFLSKDTKLAIFNKILKNYELPILTVEIVKTTNHLMNLQKELIKKTRNEVEKNKRLEEKKLIIKQKEEEKEQKRIEKEKQQKLKAPKAGTKVKGRDGSTRHGYIISYSYYHAPEITIQDIEHREELLQIIPDQCFWCKKAKKEDNDHAHPCCNTTEHEYSHTNALNIFPSCKSCNSKKGGNKLEDWINELPNIGWSSISIHKFKNWLCLNKDKLLFNREDTSFVERQFPFINKFHELCEQSARDKIELKTLVIEWAKNMELVK